MKKQKCFKRVTATTIALGLIFISNRNIYN